MVAGALFAPSSRPAVEFLRRGRLCDFAEPHKHAAEKESGDSVRIGRRDGSGYRDRLAQPRDSCLRNVSGESVARVQRPAPERSALMSATMRKSESPSPLCMFRVMSFRKSGNVAAGSTGSTAGAAGDGCDR